MARPKLNLKEIEVECVRPHYQGTDTESISLLLTVVRGPRGRRKLLGEAFTRQIYHPIIHFKVYDEGDVDALFLRFLQQLIHRGYRPVQFRNLSREERWGEWRDCDLSSLDMSALQRAEDSEMSVAEEPDSEPPYPPKAAASPK